MISLLLMACVDPPDREGIAIGNPPNLAARIAPASGGSVEVATIHVSEITSGCGTSVASVADLGAVNLLGANALPLPEASLCVLSIGASAPMELRVQLADGRIVSGHLDLGTISLMADAEITVEGGLVLELGAPGWFDAATLPADVTSIEPGSEAHALLVAAVRSGAGLYVDGNGDGHLEGDERATGALLAAAGAQTAAQTDSGGADSGEGDTGGADSGEGDTGGAGDTSGSGDDDSDDDCDDQGSSSSSSSRSGSSSSSSGNCG
jgi:hypothetical protein